MDPRTTINLVSYNVFMRPPPVGSCTDWKDARCEESRNRAAVMSQGRSIYELNNGNQDENDLEAPLLSPSLETDKGDGEASRDPIEVVEGAGPTAEAEGVQENWEKLVMECRYASTREGVLNSLHAMVEMVRHNRELCTPKRRKSIIELGKAKKAESGIDWDVDTARTFGSLLREFSVTRSAFNMAKKLIKN